MRAPRHVRLPLLSCLLIFVPLLASACERIPSQETIWIRLTAPVSTFNAKVGDPVHAVVTQDVICGGEMVFPVGASVQGTVQSVRKVGLGVRHETAQLKVVFDRISASGIPVVVMADVAAIDNAREPVSSGVVHGIRSTNTLQGTITSRLKYLPTLNPYPDIGLLLFKATFPIFPEPEIYLPAGTDIQLELKEPLINPPAVPIAYHSVPESAALRALAEMLPERSTTEELDIADVVNFAIIGSKQQFEAAFSNAGWQTADPINRHSVMMNIYAFLKNSSYAHAPMRPFLVDGVPPDMNWEKSLDTYAQRDHMRVWEWVGTGDENTIWLGTATHDKSAGISFKHREFVHHIDPEVDDERSKIIRDLRAAGCVQSVYLQARRAVRSVRENATGDPVETDGAIAVVKLQDCHAPVPELASDPEPAPYKPGSAVFRYFRREILTVRSDIWRANIIYASYDVVRMGVHAWRHHPAETLKDERSRDTNTSVAEAAGSAVTPTP